MVGDYRPAAQESPAFFSERKALHRQSQVRARLDATESEGILSNEPARRQAIIWSPAGLVSLLLKREKHQDLALAFVQRFEGFSDESARPMNRRLANLHGLRAHRVTRRWAGHEEIARGNGPVLRVDLELHPAALCDLRLVRTAFA